MSVETTVSSIEQTQENLAAYEVIYVLPPMIAGDGSGMYGTVIVEEDFPGAVPYVPLDTTSAVKRYDGAALTLLLNTALALEGLAKELESRVPEDRVEMLRRQVARLRAQKRQLIAPKQVQSIAGGSAPEAGRESE